MIFLFSDYSSELIHFKTSDALTQYYSLPDGQAVEISSEMISTPEPLFNPETLLGADDTIASQEPIHKLVNNAFRRYHVYSRYSLFVLINPITLSVIHCAAANKFKTVDVMEKYCSVAFILMVTL